MTMPPEYEEVDVNDARVHLLEALSRLNALDGRRVPTVKGSERSAVLAEVGKELLFIDHLCSMGKVLVLDEYHASRGYTGPSRRTEPVTYRVTITPTEEGS